MRMIIGSLLLMYCLHLSFIDRGDHYATFKKRKGHKIFYDQLEYGTTILRHLVL